MPSPIAHTLAAYAALLIARPALIKDRQTNSIAMGAAFVFGNLADADFAVAALTNSRVWGHHYFSHSIPFALVLTAAVYLALRLFHRRRAGTLAWLAGLAYGTHLLLDYFTEDGSKPIGIPLLWPFTNYHFPAPVEMFYSIHRGSVQSIGGPHNMEAILREAVVMSPIVLLAALLAIRRNRVVRETISASAS